jgi:hypothetical protein
MPQFDVFLFFSSVFYLLVGFFSLMFYNQFMFLPKISAFLKLRSKISLFQMTTQLIITEKKNTLIKLSKTLC